jgi:hypothetical protein
VEAIDKKGNFPAPKLRLRLPHRPTSSDDVTSLPSSPVAPTTPLSPSENAYFPHGANPNGLGVRRGSTSQDAQAATSAIDTVTASTTNNGPAKTPDKKPVDKGKRKASGDFQGNKIGEGVEMVDERPKIISPELRELMSRKVQILPRKVVRREGEGLGTVRK